MRAIALYDNFLHPANYPKADHDRLLYHWSPFLSRVSRHHSYSEISAALGAATLVFRGVWLHALLHVSLSNLTAPQTNHFTNKHYAKTTRGQSVVRERS